MTLVTDKELETRYIYPINNEDQQIHETDRSMHALYTDRDMCCTHY